jgi:hypothetical protein
MKPSTAARNGPSWPPRNESRPLSINTVYDCIAFSRRARRNCRQSGAAARWAPPIWLNPADRARAARTKIHLVVLETKDGGKTGIVPSSTYGDDHRTGYDERDGFALAL